MKSLLVAAFASFVFMNSVSSANDSQSKQEATNSFQEYQNVLIPKLERMTKIGSLFDRLNFMLDEKNYAVIERVLKGKSGSFTLETQKESERLKAQLELTRRNLQSQNPIYGVGEPKRVKDKVGGILNALIQKAKTDARDLENASMGIASVPAPAAAKKNAKKTKNGQLVSADAYSKFQAGLKDLEIVNNNSGPVNATYTSGSVPAAAPQAPVDSKKAQK